jgi:hypothetical protein
MHSEAHHTKIAARCAPAGIVVLLLLVLHPFAHAVGHAPIHEHPCGSGCGIEASASCTVHSDDCPIMSLLRAGGAASAGSAFSALIPASTQTAAPTRDARAHGLRLDTARSRSPPLYLVH